MVDFCRPGHKWYCEINPKVLFYYAFFRCAVWWRNSIQIICLSFAIMRLFDVYIHTFCFITCIMKTLIIKTFYFIPCWLQRFNDKFYLFNNIGQWIPLVCNLTVMPLVIGSTLCVTIKVTMNWKSMLLISEYACVISILMHLQ